MWGKQATQTDDQAANRSCSPRDRRESVEEAELEVASTADQGEAGQREPRPMAAVGPRVGTSQEASGSGLDAATISLIRAVTKMALRHEEKLSRLRVDMNFMMFIDVGRGAQRVADTAAGGQHVAGVLRSGDSDHVAAGGAVRGDGAEASGTTSRHAAESGQSRPSDGSRMAAAGG